MARFSVAGRSTVVGTTVRAQASLFATTGVRPRIVEIGVFNTTSTALAVAVVRFTNATGVGAGLTEVAEDDTPQVAIATAFAGHTADGAVGSPIRQATLGAAVGSGVIWTFENLTIPHTTADGIGIIVPTGTGQITDYWLTWDE
jgi:hypothetical protein